MNKIWFYDITEVEKFLCLKLLAFFNHTLCMSDWIWNQLKRYLTHKLNFFDSVGISIFINVLAPIKLALILVNFREMRHLMQLSSSSAHEKCHNSESRHHSVHAYPSELELHRDDAPVHSQHLQPNHDRIRKTQESSTIDITRHQVSPAATSLTTPTNHWRWNITYFFNITDWFWFRRKIISREKSFCGLNIQHSHPQSDIKLFPSHS